MYFSLQPCSNRRTAKRKSPNEYGILRLFGRKRKSKYPVLSIARTIYQSLCGSVESSHFRSIGLSFGQSISRTIERSICRIIEHSRVTCFHFRGYGTNRHLFSLPQYLYFFIVSIFGFPCFPSVSLLFSIPFFYAVMSLPLHTTITATDCI